MSTFLTKTSALTLATLLTTTTAYADLVKNGVLTPLTGPTASDGEEFVRGVELAVKEANANGGVAGHTFEVVTADVVDLSAANPERPRCPHWHTPRGRFTRDRQSQA